MALYTAQELSPWIPRARLLKEISQLTLYAPTLSPSPSSAGSHIPQHQCIKNLTAVLEEAGTVIEKVIKVNVFLASMDDFAKMNEVYKTYWGDVKPSRT
jgi:hypothetical protein